MNTRQVHRPAYSAALAGGNSPIGEVAVLRDLVSAHHCDIDHAAPNNPKGIGVVNDGHQGTGGHELSPCIDQVLVLVTLCGDWAVSDHAIF